MEKTVLFAASSLGIKASKRLKNKYNIVAFVDNNYKLWQSKVENITVISPENLKKYKNVKVIITSSYYFEIATQIFELGITDVEIYIEDNSEIGYILERVDYLEGFKYSKSKILIIISFYSVYMQEYIFNLYKYYNIRVDILTMDKGYLEKINREYVNNIYYYNNLVAFDRVIELGEYEFIHIQFLEYIYIKSKVLLENIKKKLIITYWGSDFYRQSKEIKQKEKVLLKRADLITFDNVTMLNEFCDEMGQEFKEKCLIKRFGLTALDIIKNNKENIVDIKIKMNLPLDKIIIMCGYNGIREQNHISLLKSIFKLNKEVLNKIFLIIPMTYGVVEYEYFCEIKNMLQRSKIGFKVLEDFMDFKEISNLTKVVDIMIHVQTTDALSATMLEHLYNGNIVIAGSWLPYKELKEKEIKFISIDDIDDIKFEINRIVENIKKEYEKFKMNSEKVYKLSSWNNNILSWKELYK